MKTALLLILCKSNLNECYQWPKISNKSKQLGKRTSDNEKWAKTNSIAREYVQRSVGIRNNKKYATKIDSVGGVLMVWAYTKSNGRNLKKLMEHWTAKSMLLC